MADGTKCGALLTLLPGINVSDIQRLKANSLHTVGAVHSMTTKNLLKIKGFSDAKVDKIKDAVRKLIVCHLKNLDLQSLTRI